MTARVAADEGDVRSDVIDLDEIFGIQVLYADGTSVRYDDDTPVRYDAP